MKRILMISALLFASNELSAQDLTGPWTIYTNMQGADIPQQCNFVVTGNKVTGTCGNMFQGNTIPINGNVEGKMVTWKYGGDFNHNFKFSITYSGILDRSGKILGTFVFAPPMLDGFFTAVPGAAPTPTESVFGGMRMPPNRDPHNTPGYVESKDLPDGTLPPVSTDGNFVLGPTHKPAPEVLTQPDVPKGKVIVFEMKSTDSKIYPGIMRDPGTFGYPDPSNPAKLIVTTSHPAPYTREVAVYVPAEYKPGTEAPFIAGEDAAGDETLINALDNLIAQHRIPVMIAIMVGPGGGDAMGSERGLEMDTMSGRYAEFVETEVLPRVEAEAHVKLTHDPDGRASMGASAGGTSAFKEAWYHPDLYHRVLGISPQFINQQWPWNPETPHGGWEFAEHLIADSPAKPIRVWMSIGASDAYNPNVMRDGFHDSVLASELVASALGNQGYHYQFVFARNAGHVDGAVKQQTLAEALEYLWQGYPIDKK
jgi:enterochelin esterase family protein